MMATPLEDDTVWIGFMDIVPVIGTVKEAVELVLALYEGNKAVIKEKEEALENIVNVSHISISYIQRLTDSKANSPNIPKQKSAVKNFDMNLASKTHKNPRTLLLLSELS